jgi:type II secretory pathway pseudopilin PulG
MNEEPLAMNREPSATPLVRESFLAPHSAGIPSCAEARGPRHLSGRPSRRAFSLQEVMVAVGVLGIGLIMVASIFPVAMSQHRDAVEGASTLTLAHRAQALMDAKLDTISAPPAGLWKPVSNGTLPAGMDSPWLVLPAPRLLAGGGWGAAPYFNAINTLGAAPALNGLHFGPGDILSDPRAPLDDAQAEESAFRLLWYGFYRENAAHHLDFAAAVCRQKRTDTFANQDLSDLAQNANGRVEAFVSPTVDPANLLAAPVISRLPMPWRVTVGCVGYAGSRRLSNNFPDNAAGAGLGFLAPPGSKIVITGWWYGTAPLPAIGSGRVLTVTAASGYEVDVLEDVSDLPIYNSATNDWSFDVWVFPPPFNAGGFGKKSPVLDWVFF